MYAPPKGGLFLCVFTYMMISVFRFFGLRIAKGAHAENTAKGPPDAAGLFVCDSALDLKVRSDLRLCENTF
jgi:hypothetical protein